MKKIISLLIVIAGVTYLYFWYVRGVNLFAQEVEEMYLPPYSIAMRVEGDPTESMTWQQAPRMPTARTAVGAAALGGQIYVVGGFDAFARSLDVVEAFDPADNSWTRLLPLPKPLYGVTLAAVEGKLYAMGGIEGIRASAVDDVFIFDPETGEWAEGPSLPEPLGGAAAVVDDGLIHLYGGRSSGGSTASYFVFDPVEEKWTVGEPMFTTRERHAAVLIDDGHYVVGGRSTSILYPIHYLDMHEVGSGMWDRLENMPTSRGSLGAVAHGGNLYVFGGESATNVFGAVLEYNLKARRWKEVSDMPTPRQGAAVIRINNKVHVIGGGLHPGISVSDIHEVFSF